VADSRRLARERTRCLRLERFHQERLDRFEEATKILISLCASSAHTFDGKYFQSPTRRTTGSGEQSLPILIGGRREANDAIAARYADE